MHLPDKHDRGREGTAGRDPSSVVRGRRRPSTLLRMGQLSDTHVDVRNDVYEENLARVRDPTMSSLPFNNWNTDFVELYRAAKA